MAFLSPENLLRPGILEFSGSYCLDLWGKFLYRDWLVITATHIIGFIALQHMWRTSHVLQGKSVNTWYKGRHSFISLYRITAWGIFQKNFFLCNYRQFLEFSQFFVEIYGQNLAVIKNLNLLVRNFHIRRVLWNKLLVIVSQASLPLRHRLWQKSFAVFAPQYLRSRQLHQIL